MLSRYDFVIQSLETHLFFARIMKEHAFFLQVGFTPRDVKFIKKASELREAFEEFLADVVATSDGVVSRDFLRSDQAVTEYTVEAEKATEFYTSVPFSTKLTKAELDLAPGMGRIEPMLERNVFRLNRRAISLINEIIHFKNAILNDVLACKMFTLNYPLLIDHILREARLYLHLIMKLQGREVINIQREAFEQEAFWNRIMAEHAKFIRGLLDPTEEELIMTAHDFGKEFDRLTMEAKEAMDCTCGRNVTEESLVATRNIRDFKATATKGLLDCQIKSIIIPLLGDHTLREANHFLYLLKIFKK
jgi:hypothetical protein